MNNQTAYQDRQLLESSGQLPDRSRIAAWLHSAVLAAVVFIAGIGTAGADMVFDFQMKLAQKGNAEAMYKIGEMYESGRGVEKNTEEAMKWIQKAADKGHEPARFKLLYKDIEKNGVNDGNKGQLEQLKAKAAAGDEVAQYYTGLMLARGIGMKKDESKALDLLNQSALKGMTAAEAEVTRLREVQAAETAKREAEARKRKEREAARKREAERQRLEAERKAAAAAAAAEAERKRREAEAAAAQRKAEQQRLAEEAEEKARREQAARRAAAQKAEEERRRQALIEERKRKEEEQKAQFEADPCEGKSARFLSTCR